MIAWKHKPQMSLAAGLLAAFLAAGCSENKVTRNNFDTIVEGTSTRDEVRWTMGDKHLIDRGDHWEYDVSDKHLSVFFFFDEQGKVRKKEWWDGKTGEIGGTPDQREGDPYSDESRNRTIKK